MFRLCIVLALLAATGCASSQHLLPPEGRVYPDDRPIPQPRARHVSLAQEIIDKSFDYQLKQALDLPRMGRKLTGHPYQALNVDAFGGVPNSSWFTNRNGTTPMSLADIRRGPGRTGGPDTTGTWTVVALKRAGVTPGMTVVDARGDRYIIKFDPPDIPELPSGAEAVGSRLLYATGYNVPENDITYLDPKRLVPGPEAVVTVETNDKRIPASTRPMTREDLDAIVKQTNPQGRSRVRVLASRFLPGTLIGPWSYTGVRKDDSNDIYPHEHRREIRGFYVIASWLNHADFKEENTMDTYDPERRTVTHYLFDFGASMGSNSTQASSPRRGQANRLDVKDSLSRLMTLGLAVHNYERADQTVHYPSVGYLENDLFRPNHWRPMYPVPAFENLTKRDAFWGARIVTAFTDAQIEAAVSAGAFSDPKAAAYLAQFLKTRRDKIGRYWFERLNPLDQFTLTGGATLAFSDLAVARGYADRGQTRYRFEVLSSEGAPLKAGQLRGLHLALESGWSQHDHIVVSLVPQRPGHRAKPCLVYLQPGPDGWKLLGLRRLD